MGVWSSVSFCNFDKQRIRHPDYDAYNPSRRNSSVKQILNLDSDSFTTTVLQDVQEIRIQETNDCFETSIQPTFNYTKNESFVLPEYFEYSMGGNIRFYKEHLQHASERENRISPFKKLGQRLRKSSHSDNDSEPESQRYARKSQEKVIPLVNTISEEPELSFDDYSSIYQPEFILNINSENLVKEIPGNISGENVVRRNKEEIKDRKKNNENNGASCSKNLIEENSPKNVVENVDVHVKQTKSEIVPPVKEDAFFTNHDVFTFYSTSVEENPKRKFRKNQDFALEEDKDNKNTLKKAVKIGKSEVSRKNLTTSVKIQKPRKVIQSEESNVIKAKDVLPSEKFSHRKQDKDVLHCSTSPLRKAENRIEKKDRARKPQKKEKPRDLSQLKKFDSEKHLLSRTEDNSTSDNKKGSFLSRLNISTTPITFDDCDLFEELETIEKTINDEPRKKDETFYPESPISEVHFFKTPCSTRHNSLETFEQLENECIEDDNNQEPEKPQNETLRPNVSPNYTKLPKEFQEMARRLSRKDSPKKSTPSLDQVNSSLNFNCSSSTCSTTSPRSPSGRTLFRTPSYKMPKTPSLSRQHPSTYVTQHTSSRSRPSSRVSSRATSPTREHIEALL
ncbi:muscle M-line assembly protein unc-89-like [Dendronephthya gigantea]|uniref:muscle M-line assembly protein unc-89-like n=1 Tax=Dendronephthya gigantea TaxID=151771 RepID=UPI00106CD539|nr:muscle M-line assembly protein unc-89-like [Dendronephthya gigantea]